MAGRMMSLSMTLSSEWVATSHCHPFPTPPQDRNDTFVL